MRLLVFLLTPLALVAQLRADGYSLSGTVVNSQTGAPVKNALVTLLKFPLVPPDPSNMKPADWTPVSKTTLTGPDGEFQFTGLSEGRCQLRAEKPGFMLIDDVSMPGSQSGIELKSSVAGVALRLSPLGSIEGQVLDQYGDPVSGVTVEALQVRVEDGVRTTRADLSIFTNDLGKFRMYDLLPGDYYIKAVSRNGGTFAVVNGRSLPSNTFEGFAPVYFGGAHDLESASPVKLGPGDQARADIAITRQPAVKIRGVLSGFATHQRIQFELRQREEAVPANLASFNTTTGRFEIHGVIPGAYSLRATQGNNARGETPITVSDADLNDVSLTLSPAVTVRVITQTTGPLPKDTILLDGLGHQDPEDCLLTLHSSDHNADPLCTGPGKTEGESVVENVLPGEYRVQFQSIGGYPTSVQSGEIDLLANPLLTVSPGVTPAPIEIAFKRGGGQLAVQLAANPMPQRLGVLLVPAFSPSSGPVMELCAPQGPHGPQVMFVGLAPGDYLVYAFAKPDTIEFRNPAFLQSLTGGTPVHIGDYEEKEITLSTFVQ